MFHTPRWFNTTNPIPWVSSCKLARDVAETSLIRNERSSVESCCSACMCIIALPPYGFCYIQILRTLSESMWVYNFLERKGDWDLRLCEELPSTARYYSTMKFMTTLQNKSMFKLNTSYPTLWRRKKRAYVITGYKHCLLYVHMSSVIFCLNFMNSSAVAFLRICSYS